MSKVKKFGPPRIKKISGGKDPTRLVEDFIARKGFEPEECLRQRTGDVCTWCVPSTDEEELEITLEGLNRPMETTLYMGLNVLTVPIKQCERFLAAALIVADRLIGAKLSLVNYDFVLSVTTYLGDRGMEELDYFFELIDRQKNWLRDEIIQEALKDEFEPE
ncbi:MAG: hypothetical protein IT290_07035 [Deltaproteobacteria bacterium]|nr:hypothetical protein [Deltaproteobacteria bacterium]